MTDDTQSTQTASDPTIDSAAFTGTTHIAAVLDKSGSMGRVRRETIDGFNSWLAGMKANPADPSAVERLRFTLTLFDTSYSTPIKDAPITKVNSLDESRYQPSGSTALLDATADAVRAMPDNGTDRYLVVILTDGEENASTHTTKEDLAALIAEKEATGRWTFAYLSAGMDAFGDAASIGISAGNTQAYTGDEAGMRDAFHSVTMSVQSYSSSPRASTASLFGGSRHASSGGSDSWGGSAPSTARPRARTPIASPTPAPAVTRAAGSSAPSSWLSGSDPDALGGTGWLSS